MSNFGLRLYDDFDGDETPWTFDDDHHSAYNAAEHFAGCRADENMEDEEILEVEVLHEDGKIERYTFVAQVSVEVSYNGRETVRGAT